MICENLITLLVLASTVLLARALWQIRGFFKAHGELMLNSRLMGVHVSMLVLVVLVDLVWGTSLEVIVAKQKWTLLAYMDAGYFVL